MNLHDFLNRFARDERGLAAEFALVLPLFLILFLGTIDVGIYAWRINQAEKATQAGARFAAVTNPLAEELLTASYVNTTVSTTAGNVTIGQGDRIPREALGLLTCTNTSCTCTTSPCPGTTRDPDAFTALATRMRAIYGAIEDTNIVVEYRGSGLGFAGDPNGPDIAPLITVRLVNMQYTPVTLSPLGTTVSLPDFAYSLTSEDASGTASN
uniref:TadE/TadG family type IV pilus assembly protein n=1 Tax=uncultured Altererythrobacter sp. TaxID=500840 RepID=UPI00260DC011|nr:TadE/TadG family type IV pilus assembly protein [uncultured Altererythrobacter sp.]